MKTSILFDAFQSESRSRLDRAVVEFFSSLDTQKNLIANMDSQDIIRISSPNFQLINVKAPFGRLEV